MVKVEFENTQLEQFVMDLQRKLQEKESGHKYNSTTRRTSSLPPGDAYSMAMVQDGPEAQADVGQSTSLMMFI
jgi:hypothetical protein